MSSAPLMTSGMTGTTQSNVIGSMPGVGQGLPTNPNKPPVYGSEPIQPKLYPDNIDYSTRRNVLPCKGINIHVLRPQPPPAAAGMVPIGGVGRHQMPALSQDKPTNLPILKNSNPFASETNNPLGQPN